MQITGRILAIQEQRFRLAADDGRVYLLTLGREAPLEAEDLAQFKATGAHLAVDYRGEPNLTSGVAYSVRRDAR